MAVIFCCMRIARECFEMADDILKNNDLINKLGIIVITIFISSKVFQDILWILTRI
jgi:hypothetical protein